ncbi:hypothetical protein KZZ52_42395 [Dactylosporangium sp. AC04546]|uniref:hypothetical protein n=1 Tax=Dactylosporangium sp. AC04546 TaxID=2862460 RepID=UPI001EE04F8C|nr:hypothetical protein [Dactylosporangium sp. AC04546]WVK80567.1 hypothetical protein KZZ52_42395 [Dactylosporangium sp. AC04546]
MTQMGCTGKVIDTQLFSKETGRCMLGDDEVTIAVFDTPQLRDEWVKAGKQFGGNYVVGPNWAAGMDRLNTAATVAEKLKGEKV